MLTFIKLIDLHSLEKLLLQALSDEVVKVRRSDVSHSKCSDHSLLSSCWQKSIRRGNIDEAVICALALHSQNPDYVFRRIRSIALEEVSVADLDLVAQVLAIAGKRVLRHKLGERALLTLLTTRLAAAAKCRTPCDLLVWLPQTQELAGAGLHPEFDSQNLLTSDVSNLRHTAALWLSIAPRSIRTRSGWRVVSGGNSAYRDAWLDAAEMPPLVRYIVKRGSSTDALNALLVPAYQLALGGAQLVIAPPPVATSLEVIHSVPAYAFCLYSEPGRAALRRFISRHEQWRRRFHALGVTDLLRALGHMVFHVEGGYCAQILMIPRGMEIKSLSEATILARCGVPQAEIRKLEALVTRALPALNICRRATVVNYG